MTLLLQNAFFMRWDLYVLLLLLFTAVVTPVEVAFLTTGLNPLFFINRVVDASFLVVRHRCRKHPVVAVAL